MNPAHDKAQNAAERAHDDESDPTNARRGSDDPRAGSGASARDAEQPGGGRRVSVPPDSGIVGGGAPGDSVDIGTASGPSDSGGG